MSSRKYVKLAAAVIAVTGITVAWSEFHSDINRFLGHPEYDDAFLFVMFFVAGVSLVFPIAGLVTALSIRHTTGDVGRIVRANLAVPAVALLPVFGWMISREQAFLYLGLYAVIGYWPLILVAAIAVNVIAARHTRARLPRGE